MRRRPDMSFTDRLCAIDLQMLDVKKDIYQTREDMEELPVVISGMSVT